MFGSGVVICTLKNNKQGGKGLSIRDGLFEGTYLFFPPNIARWKLGRNSKGVSGVVH